MIRSATARQNLLVFFTMDVGDVGTVTRAGAFVANGFELVVASFRRRNWYNADHRPSHEHIHLGLTQDARYFHRLVAVLRAIIVLLSNRARIENASYFYARNFDQLVIATALSKVLGSRPTLIYEVLDVPPLFSRKGILSSVLRKIEAFLLRSVDLLATSSGGYIDNYYRAKLMYEGRTVLVENKLPWSSESLRESNPKLRPDRKSTFRWTVGYFGTIKGEKTIQELLSVARACGDVEFLFAGIPTSIDRDAFFRAIDELPNVRFAGPYKNPEDLPGLYSQVDLTWAIDLTDEEANSRWCMPCRYYESGFFDVPLLVAQGQYVAEHVLKHGIGWAFGGRYADEVKSFLDSLKMDEYLRTRERLEALPRNLFADQTRGQDLADAIRATR